MTKRVLSGYYDLTKPGITLFIGTSAAAGFITAGGGTDVLGLLESARRQLERVASHDPALSPIVDSIADLLDEIG